jgi:hypothetical protein
LLTGGPPLCHIDGKKYEKDSGDPTDADEREVVEAYPHGFYWDWWVALDSPIRKHPEIGDRESAKAIYGQTS